MIKTFIKILIGVIIVSFFMAVGGVTGYFIFYPGVIFETPDQLSMLTLITGPGGIVLGGIIGYLISRKILE